MPKSPQNERSGSNVQRRKAADGEQARTGPVQPPLAQLQGLIGNAQVSHMLAQRAPTEEEEEGGIGQATPEVGLAHQCLNRSSIQRDSQIAREYSPPTDYAISNFFYLNHIPDEFNAQSAIEMQEVRGGTSTIIQLLNSDAQYEIFSYLERLNANESHRVSNSQQIQFNTIKEYRVIQVGNNVHNNGSEIQLDGRFRVRLSAIWINENDRHEGYFQLNHFIGVIV